MIFNLNHLPLTIVKNFVELGWWVGDGSERYHDEMGIGFDLVWGWVSHDSADFIVAVDYTADSISYPSWRLTCFVSLRSNGGSTIPLGLTSADLVGLRNCHTCDNSNKSDKRFDLLKIQSNVQDPMLIKEVQEEKWASGNSVWYCIL